jgi:hypothetical protein
VTTLFPVDAVERARKLLKSFGVGGTWIPQVHGPAHSQGVAGFRLLNPVTLNPEYSLWGQGIMLLQPVLLNRCATMAPLANIHGITEVEGLRADVPTQCVPKAARPPCFFHSVSSHHASIPGDVLGPCLISTGVGAYTDSRGNSAVEKKVADFRAGGGGRG